MKQMNRERSLAAIYHLLTGKKSIQTVQDAHIYHLTNFYGIIPSLKKVYFDHHIDQFVKKGYCIKEQEGTCIDITEKGNQWLQVNKDFSIHLFNGIQFHRIDQIFFKRLLLFIQMITNRKMKYHSYIPIVDDPTVTSWARKTYHMIKGDIDVILLKLHRELTQLLRQLPDQEANIFVDRLTGYQTYGMSINQLANKYHISLLDTHLILIRTIHKFITEISKQTSKYAVLRQLLNHMPENTFITRSAYRTYQLLKRGYSHETIAKIRGLKESTICDHLVEISLYDDNFPFQDYLQNDTYEEITRITSNQRSFKLKDIKRQVHPEITYFQIRLALAKKSWEQRKHAL